MPTYALILAIGAGHASLLLGSARAGEGESVRLVRIGVLAAIVILCTMAIVDISVRGRDIGVRPTAIVAVLYVLGTILLPLLRRASAEPVRN